MIIPNTSQFLLLVLFVVIVAIMFMVKYNTGNVKTGGNAVRRKNLRSYFGGSSTSVAEDTYNKIIPVVESVGTSKHLEKYLAEILDVKVVEVSDYTNHKHLIAYKPLFELLIIAAEKTGAESAEELILLTDLRYQWYLSAEQGSALMARRKFSSDHKGVLMAIIDDYSGKAIRQLLTNEKEKLVDKLTPISISYRRFSDNVKNKKASALKHVDVILDVVAISGLVKVLVDRLTVKNNAIPPIPTSMSIRQKLDDVNLIDMYPREPYLVKAFIERIKREIKTIEYNTDYWRNIVPLGRDALRVTLHDIAQKEILEEQLMRQRAAVVSPLDAAVPYRVNASRSAPAAFVSRREPLRSTKD